MSKKRGATDVPVADDPSNIVEVIPLGAGQEVGRSCVILKYQGKTVMFDCGIHPGLKGNDALPYIDSGYVDMDTVDVALITHFHLDHCAAVPYLVSKTTFKGKIFMTHPTKAIYHQLLKDYVKVSKGSADEQLYSAADLEASMKKVQVIDFHQTFEVEGIKITPYRAGHVLGAAMFMVEIDGMTALYTGDYSRLPDRHLSGADTPPITPHIVIVESTYGTSRHLPALEREKRFIDKVHEVVSRGGRVLMPIVALGRAQELLLILEEHWARHPELQHIPIYQASGLARKALTVYQTYVEMMNDDIKAAFQVRNPFMFRHVQHLKSGAQFDDVGPCVMMATPSMLQSGTSRDLFEAWCEDERNAVIICDFAVQGTLARDIQGAPEYITSRKGTRLQLKMEVEVISFSAHADYDQTSGFLDVVQPPHVVLVHGEVEGMKRLRAALANTALQNKIERHMHMPANGSAVQIDYKPRRVARVVGQLAEKPLRPGQALHGVLVRRGQQDSIMLPEELPSFTTLHTGKILQRQSIALDKPFSEVRLALEVMFEGVEGAGALHVSGSPSRAAAGGGEAGSSGSDGECVKIGDVVTATYRAANSKAGVGSHVVLEWESGSIGDMVADAVVAVILQAAGEPVAASEAEAARMRALAAGDDEGAQAAEMELAAALLRAQFGPTCVDAVRGVIRLVCDDYEVVVDMKAGKVYCADDDRMRVRVEKAMVRVMEAMKPCGLDFAV